MKHSRNTVPAATSWPAFPELDPVGDTADPGLRNRAVAPDRTTRPRHRALTPRVGETLGIRTSTLSFANMSHHGDLLVKYLKARKSVFIDRLNWNLPSTDNMEFDQYDTPMCRWVVIHEFGEILGGVRLMPTVAQCGTYSYMLRDGQLGLLDDFPSDVLFFQAPVAHDIWEASRLFISDIVPAHRRSRVQYLLMRQMIIAASELHAKNVIGIVPAVWSRWLRRLGLYAVPVGPRFAIGSMSSQAALFNVADQLDWATQDMMDIKF